MGGRYAENEGHIMVPTLQVISDRQTLVVIIFILSEEIRP